MLKQLSVIAIALLATQANAAVGQPFVTLGFGQSTYSDACEDVGGNCDDKDTAFRVGAGVEFAPMYSAELTYLNHGEATDKSSGFGLFDNYALEAETFALQVGATVNVAPQFNLYGKAGIALTKAEASNNYGAINGVQFTDSVDEDTTGAILSIGAQFAVMPNLMADIQFDFLPDAIEFKDAEFESDITTISAGFKYQF
ncbi:MAG: porin family protein [Moraxellaceae bacterium]